MPTLEWWVRAAEESPRFDIGATEGCAAACRCPMVKFMVKLMLKLMVKLMAKGCMSLCTGELNAIMLSL